MGLVDDSVVQRSHTKHNNHQLSEKENFIYDRRPDQRRRCRNEPLRPTHAFQGQLVPQLTRTVFTMATFAFPGNVLQLKTTERGECEAVTLSRKEQDVDTTSVFG